MLEICAAPLFSVIGDTTIDISKTDQYSNCIRYMHFDNKWCLQWSSAKNSANCTKRSLCSLCVPSTKPRCISAPRCSSITKVLGNAATLCAEIKTFFSIVQQIYVFFGGSAPRWAFLRAFSSNQEKQILLKSLCATRWENRHSSVTINRYPDLIKALTHLKLTSSN